MAKRLPAFRHPIIVINARAETAAEKKLFASAMRERRIILPATSFFEWSRDPGKAKYAFTVGGRPTLYLCGLYEVVDGVTRFVILTREANESMAEVHDRMPVIAAEAEVRPYLTDHQSAKRILAEAAPELIGRLAN